MDIDNDEIITILCKLADSRGLNVTSNENSRFSVKDVLNADKPGPGQLLEQFSNKNFLQGAAPQFLVHNATVTDNSSAEGSVNAWLPMISIASFLGGLAFSGVKVFYSRTWKYLFGDHEISFTIDVAPVSSVLKELPSTDQEKLTKKIRRIMQDHNITNKDTLVAEIEKDSSYVREIILEHIEKYMEEDLSMPITRGS